MKKPHGKAARRNGFSLVELVVVVLIMGIVAAVAAPRMFDKITEARENSTRQSLSVMRNAIEQYKMNDANNQYPTLAQLTTDVPANLLRGAFPETEVGANKNSSVAASTQDPITSVEAGTDGWVYNASTGEFRINDATYIGW